MPLSPSNPPPLPFNRLCDRGTVRRLLPSGCGFITVTGKRDHFFHTSDLQPPFVFSDLQEGSVLDFVSEPDLRGGPKPRLPRARRIVIIG